MYTAEYYADKLQMLPHPEGGWYKETYRAAETVASSALPTRFGGERNFSTAIFFLLTGKTFSAFHRIKSDEVWHFYAGSCLNIYVIDSRGQLRTIKLGNNPERGEEFQAVVKAGSWFASQPEQEDTFSLVGCTVAPGFDFKDFELANREELVSLFPEHRALIEKYCRQ